MSRDQSTRLQREIAERYGSTTPTAAGPGRTALTNELEDELQDELQEQHDEQHDQQSEEGAPVAEQRPRSVFEGATELVRSKKPNS